MIGVSKIKPEAFSEKEDIFLRIPHLLYGLFFWYSLLKGALGGSERHTHRYTCNVCKMRPYRYKQPRAPYVSYLFILYLLLTNYN